jgi:hypothetical protein
LEGFFDASATAVTANFEGGAIRVIVPILNQRYFRRTTLDPRLVAERVP